MNESPQAFDAGPTVTSPVINEGRINRQKDPHVAFVRIERKPDHLPLMDNQTKNPDYINLSRFIRVTAP